MEHVLSYWHELHGKVQIDKYSCVYWISPVNIPLTQLDKVFWFCFQHWQPQWLECSQSNKHGLHGELLRCE
jgi:hypothetical protein